MISNINIPVILLNNVDYHSLILPLDRVKIRIDPDQSYEQQSILYQHYIKELNDKGLFDSAADLDRLFKQLQYKKNDNAFYGFIDRVWWDYGYTKSKVVKNSLYIFGLFILLNLLFYKYLTAVYLPKSIKTYRDQLRTIVAKNRYEKTRKKTFQFLSVVVYTSFLFWGLKLDLEDIRLKHWGALLLIFAQYVVGVICLAYIGNYIITK